MKRFTKSILAVLCCSLMLIGTVVLAAQKQNIVQAYAEEGVTSFVSRLYTVILGREADADGLESWVSQLSDGTKTGVDVTEGFLLSEEFLEKELSEEEFVQTLYRAFFDREADTDGLAGWLARFEQGYGKKYVIKQFAGSDEFEELCESYNIERGNVVLTQAEQNPELSEQEYAVWEFVERFYVEFLGRPADYDGLKGWADKLLAGTMSGVEVAEGFFVSEEFQNKVLTNEEYVHTLYRAFFNRPADEGGLEKWVGRLGNGYVKKNVFGGLAVSDEFEDLCESYGIARGDVYLTLAEQTPNLSEKEFNVWQFVERFYMEVLGRVPDLGGLKSWADKLLAGTASGAEVAEGFIFSDEFVNKNVGNEEYIKIMYRAFFGREADDAGLNSWLQKLYNGETRRMAFAGFVNSEEFGALCNSYEIKQGTVAALEGAPEKPDPDNAGDEIRVYWSTMKGATQYGIWRSETGEEDSYECLAIVEPEDNWNYYVDDAVSHNTLYYYKLSALDPGTGNHKMSEATPVLFLDIPNTFRLFATSSSSVTCNWSSYPDVDGYIVYVEDMNGYEETFTIEGCTANSYTIEGLESETYYNVGVRCYKIVEGLGTFESTWVQNGITTLVDEADQYGTFEYEELDDGTLMLTYYDGNQTNIVIPSEIGGKKVTVIGEYCFIDSYDSIVTVQIPNTITTIGYGAFESCYNLQEITIPNSVTYIGEYAFGYCESLTKLHIPASVKYFNVYDYGDGELEQFTLYGMYNLKEFTVDAANPSYCAVNGILYNKNKTQLICVPDAYEGTVKIADTVTTMEIAAPFDGCRLVTEIVIPKNMTYFDNTSYGCDSLEKYTVASGNTQYTTIDGVLYNSSKTTLVSVPCTVAEESYAIRTGVTQVNPFAFTSCSFVENIHVPASVEKLGSLCGGTYKIGTKDNVYENVYDNIFDYCYSLVSITVDEANRYYKAVDGVLFSKDGKVLVAYPEEKQGESYAVPNSVTAIGMSAMGGNWYLKQLSLPASVEVIQPYAFQNSYFETIELSEGLKVIGYGAFSGAEVVEVIVPDSVERIDWRAFQNCRNLESIKLSSSLTKIEQAVFRYCTALQSITIPEGVTEIQNQAFENCRELKEVKLPSTLKSIGRNAFRNCAMNTIELPDGLQSIDKTAFVGCGDLTIIASPGSVGAKFATDYGFNLAN